MRLLVDTDRFTGERTLLHVEIVTLQQTHIGGHLVAGFEHHHIAGNQQIGIELMSFTAAQCHAADLQQLTNGGQGALCLALLQQAEQGIDDDHPENHGAIDPVIRKPTQAGGQQQYIDQQIIELPSETVQPGLALRRRQPVGAIFGQPMASFLVA